MWKDHPARKELLALYREVDALYAPVTCPASAECCHFSQTGREPYPHAVEMAEVDHALRAQGNPKRSLVVGVCPLLGPGGRCRIYASRPLGCRTFFCERATGMDAVPRDLRDKTLEIGRRIADLSARTFPRDPGPRPFTNALRRPSAGLER